MEEVIFLEEEKREQDFDADGFKPPSERQRFFHPPPTCVGSMILVAAEDSANSLPMLKTSQGEPNTRSGSSVSIDSGLFTSGSVRIPP